HAREYWFPDIRSLGGAIALFILTLYPYVYLVARAAFLAQTAPTLEPARLLGASRVATFLRVGLPLARPAIVAGMALAMMETLAEFGPVAFFGVPTFSTGIYRAWFSLGDPHAAAQLALVMLLFVLAILGVERALRGRARRHERGVRRHPAHEPLRGAAGALAAAACATPVLLGFAVPAAILFRMAIRHGDAQFGPRFVELTINSFSLAGIASAAAVALALLVAYASRISRGRAVALAARAAGTGYALPGSIIAVGVLIPLTAL